MSVSSDRHAAHFVPWALRAHGSGFEGATPFLAAHGLAAGLSYAQVSRYADSALARTSTLALRVVAAGADSCATGLSSDQTVEIQDDEAVTLSLTGLLEGTPAPKFLATTSFLGAPKSDYCTTNFVHAAVGVGDVVADYVKDGRSVSGWGDRTVAYGDDSGYIDTRPSAAPVALRIRAGSTTVTYGSAALSLEAGEVSLAFAVGEAGGEKPLAGLYCRDQQSAAGLTTCLVLSSL